MTSKTFNPKTAPGHQVLAAAGKTILRPGGQAASQRLWTWADFSPGDTVLELASSFGVSAIALAQRFGVNVVGVEQNPESVQRAREAVREAGLGDRIRFLETSIFNLDQLEEQFDGVLAEAILTMQAPAGKAKLFQLIHDRLKPGGVFLSHEMKTTTPEVSEALAASLRVNAQPLTAEAWQELAQEAGLTVQRQESGPMDLLNLPRLIEDEGVVGTVKFASNLILHPELRDRILEMRQVFHQYQSSLGYWLMAAQRQPD
ncbi:class I SAM-dependent methyltransferase [Phormidium yuhuli AB48]|uniref:Class I SAM-dependent methyltransferase n=1 Tax=Phormidium yuhuli AB48 TaxID=2940671 RepID=A0ABY5APC3_9CYAN|nr:class I SAM-dependent methyltransferase [Phormidium yuhuli]USR90860.1 class I SAM-dependent methyltransferase [Phormidium yuhuli AB48]